MSTENDNLPSDEHLSSIYKETSQDMPAADLDDAIVAAARRETASRPHPAFSPFSGSWRIPAAVAALVVLSFSLVTLMENDVMPVDGLAPPALEEAELLQPPSVVMADKNVLREEKRELAKTAPRKPAMKSRNDVSPATSQAFVAEQAKKRALIHEAERKKKQQAAAVVAESIASPDAVRPRAPALRSRLLTVPSVELIKTLRLKGDIKQANQAAEAFIRLHFGDDLTKVDPVQVKLPTEQWQALIVELRKLERMQQADQIQELLDRRQQN